MGIYGGLVMRWLRCWLPTSYNWPTILGYGVLMPVLATFLLFSLAVCSPLIIVLLCYYIGESVVRGAYNRYQMFFKGGDCESENYWYDCIVHVSCWCLITILLVRFVSGDWTSGFASGCLAFMLALLFEFGYAAGDQFYGPLSSYKTPVPVNNNNRSWVPSNYNDAPTKPWLAPAPTPQKPKPWAWVGYQENSGPKEDSLYLIGE
jgi:hypothetical protein